jgi:hypothetical protein
MREELFTLCKNLFPDSFIQYEPMSLPPQLAPKYSESERKHAVKDDGNRAAGTVRLSLTEVCYGFEAKEDRRPDGRALGRA